MNANAPLIDLGGVPSPTPDLTTPADSNEWEAYLQGDYPVRGKPLPATVSLTKVTPTSPLGSWDALMAGAT